MFQPTNDLRKIAEQMTRPIVLYPSFMTFRLKPPVKVLVVSCIFIVVLPLLFTVLDEELKELQLRVGVVK